MLAVKGQFLSRVCDALSNTSRWYLYLPNKRPTASKLNNRDRGVGRGGEGEGPNLKVAPRSLNKRCSQLLQKIKNDKKDGDSLKGFNW